MNRGFNLVEAVVAVTLAAAFILALSSINTYYVRAALGHDLAIRASFAAEEGLEAARFMRDESWAVRIAPLAEGADYYLYFSGSSWQATTTPSNPSGLDRRIRFESAMRDGSANITNFGTADLNTKLVTATVAWQENGATTTKILSGYLTNLFNN